jgi:hypothetical protein
VRGADFLDLAGGFFPGNSREDEDQTQVALAVPESFPDGDLALARRRKTCIVLAMPIPPASKPRIPAPRRPITQRLAARVLPRPAARQHPGRFDIPPQSDLASDRES